MIEAVVAPMLLVHIAAGFLALVIGPFAMFSAKGGKLHRRAGTVSTLTLGFGLYLLAAGVGLFGSLDVLSLVFGLLTCALAGSAMRRLLSHEREDGRPLQVSLGPRDGR